MLRASGDGGIATTYANSKPYENASEANIHAVVLACLHRKEP